MSNTYTLADFLNSINATPFVFDKKQTWINNGAINISGQRYMTAGIMAGDDAKRLARDLHSLSEDKKSKIREIIQVLGTKTKQTNMPVDYDDSIYEVYDMPVLDPIFVRNFIENF